MPVAASPIVDLETEVKPFLNITGDDFDTKLTSFIASESQTIVTDIGHIAGSPTVEEWHDGGVDRISLYNEDPIQSVTSVVESFGPIAYTLTQVNLDSVTANAYGFTIDLDAGLIVRRSNGVAIPFAAGVRNVHVTFVAGYAMTPPDIKEACLLRIKYAWDTQRGNGRQSSGTLPPDTALFRAEEILKRYRLPGIG